MADEIDIYPEPVEGAPEGYQWYRTTAVMPVGTNTIKTIWTVCENCGMIVFFTEKHNRFHAALLKHADDLHAHERSMLAHGTGPIA